MSRIIILILSITLSGSVYGSSAKSTVILLSIDGFAHDYLEKYNPQHIINFGKSGVSAKLLPVYPSKTFPNHLSIITGTYPQKHGIVHNSFYHPELNKLYSLDAGKHNNRWLNAKPLWSHVQEQGLKSAVSFWPESEAIGQGSSPIYNIPYNKKDSEKVRFEQLLSWLHLPAHKAPKFIVSYFSSVDEAGHHFGLNSVELHQAVIQFDNLFGNFLTRIEQELTEPVTIILLSDHGMVQINNDQSIDLSMVFNSHLTTLIDEKSIRIAPSSTQFYLYLDDNKLSKSQQKSIYKQLQTVQKQYSHLYDVYQQGHYPQHWHFESELAVIPDIIINATLGSSFKRRKPSGRKIIATHGYDAIEQRQLMAIFMASGTNIIQGREVLPFENIHVAPLVTDLLGIAPLNKIDGKAEILSAIVTAN